MTTIELRRLALGDLLAIEEIERRSYPTPWSRSMFAGEPGDIEAIEPLYLRVPDVDA